MVVDTLEDKRTSVDLRGGMIQSALTVWEGRAEGMRGSRGWKAKGTFSIIVCWDKENKATKAELKSQVGNSLVNMSTWSAGSEEAVLMQGHRNTGHRNSSFSSNQRQNVLQSLVQG